MGPPEMLVLRGLAKTFDRRPVLRGVDLDAAPGELVAILGASGSGKTTLLRLLSGFERADAGSITVAGVKLCHPGLHVPAERRRIGYVAQEGALFPHLSVADNVLFGLPRAARRDHARAEALLELVGLPGGHGRRAPADLSGGEQQRVALARALAPGPQLVLLDEPFSALDAALRVETREAVAAALAATGATALLVTHDQAEALSMGHRVAVLRHGAFAQVATPDALYRRPVDPELARFVGEAVLLPGTVRGGAADCALGTLPLEAPAADGAATILVRPEQILLGHGAGVAAVVRAVTFYGHDASVVLALPGAGEITARVAGHMAPRPGETAQLRVEGGVTAYPELAIASHSQ